MHKYLKAIGFTNLEKRQDIKLLLALTEQEYDYQDAISFEDADFCELRKDYGEQISVSSYGEYVDGIYERMYYTPKFHGTGVTTYADILVERRMDQERYVGICEDIKLGISLIFHIQNGVEYMRERKLGSLVSRDTSVTLSGLCTSGMVLLPISKDEKLEQTKREENRNRMMLLSAAKNGDRDAMESLTLDDMERYTTISKRLHTEDILTIVETYFMPFGVECDEYSILGEILDVKEIENNVSRETLYVMKLDVNELQFDVCVPKHTVLGVPEVGRRFKGNIWLQGKINF